MHKFYNGKVREKERVNNHCESLLDSYFLIISKVVPYLNNNKRREWSKKIRNTVQFTSELKIYYHVGLINVATSSGPRLLQ